jgi:predicted ABC-type ATPase
VKTNRKRKGRPRCLLIAGPNGVGKTTFAREYLPTDARILNFVNADLIAAGLSPLRPELAAVAAARLVLEEIVRLIELRADFAWESTLSGLTYAKRIRAMKELVQKTDVLRRFPRSWHNFQTVYRPLADAWAVYDNSSRPPKLIESGR